MSALAISRQLIARPFLRGHRIINWNQSIGARSKGISLQLQGSRAEPFGKS
jgi:hypothetical protein